MDIKYMERALELAKNGVGHTKPNPLVGAVIVKDGKIIGEGYHEFFGGPHAEINAFRNATENVEGATMYVTLEPCSHYGKTPPCANAIVEKKLAEVIIAMEDPNPIVAGNGIRILRENGIRVESGVLEKQARKLNEIFLKYITAKRPFVILKTAMTLDGKIATVSGDSKWITNELSRQHVHRLRHQVSGIMVGIGTILADDPELTTRLTDGQGVDPTRIVVDTKARIPLQAKVLHLNSSARTILATTSQAEEEKLEAVRETGAEVIVTPQKNGRVDLNFLMERLGEKGIDSVLIEGGAALNFSALEEGVVDKVVSFIAPKLVGGSEAKTPVGGDGISRIRNAMLLEDIHVSMFQNDIMVEGYIRKGD